MCQQIARARWKRQCQQGAHFAGSIPNGITLKMEFLPLSHRMAHNAY
jgi:hypothetical protein